MLDWLDVCAGRPGYRERGDDPSARATALPAKETNMRRWLVAVVFLATACPAVLAGPPITVQSGEFVKIYDPSVGEEEAWYINDHCFAYGSDNQWHLFGITHEEPASPINEDNFAHATADALLQQPWDKQTFALSTASQAPWYEQHLWAPHVIQNDGLYYMYYCAGDADHTKYKIHLATSPDLQTWTRHPANPMVVDGYDARDPFIMRVDDQWVMYYTATSAPSGGNHTVAYATSEDLMTWEKGGVVFTDPSSGTYGGPTESPFVVRRGKYYYLFVGPRGGYDGTDIFFSYTPFSWSTASKVGHISAHAAEVVRDTNGDWYVSRCGWGRGGVYLAPLIWNDRLLDPTSNITIPGLLIPGDSDGDGDVDEADATRLAANWGTTVTGGARDGDFDGDGLVGSADASIMAANWGRRAGEAAFVPEPPLAAMFLGAMALATLTWRRRLP
jgi:beta-fructofuranosidase